MIGDGRNDVLFLIVIALKDLFDISRTARRLVGSPEPGAYAMVTVVLVFYFLE